MAESARVLGITDELLGGWLAGGGSFNDQDWASTLDWEDRGHEGRGHSWSDDGYGARQGFGGGHWSEEKEQITNGHSDGEPIGGFAASTPAAGSPTSHPNCTDSPVRTHGPRLMPVTGAICQVGGIGGGGKRGGLAIRMRGSSPYNRR